jgi:transcriptional regulator with XRE-family HTH domain
LNIFLGKTARHLRESLGLSQRRAAEALGISAVHLCNIENNKSSPSPLLLDRYRELWAVDLYVLAWCMYGETEKLPHAMRKAAADLADAWQLQIKKVIANKIKSELR